MYCSFESNCTDPTLECDWAKNVQDPDVAGVGVVIAFVLTSFITILCAIPVMLVGILDLIMSESAWTSVITKKFSREDQQRAKSTAKRRRKKLTEATESLTVGLSDQQLVTGIAIMITGYTRHCSMKSRHWWIVFDLAFFSAVTHLASLPALQRNMAKNPRLRDLRVFLMLSNYIMLLVSAILSFRDYDEKTKYCPIRCTFDRVRTKRLSISPVYTVQMILLTIAFIWQLVKLYSKQETLDRRHELITRPRIKKSETTEELDRRSRLEAQPSGESNGDGVAKIQEPQQKHSWYYGICRWIFVILISPPAPLVWAVILTMWAVGLSRLLWDRQWAIGEENQWSFGQVLPLLLVVLPFFSVLQVLEERNAPEVEAINSHKTEFNSPSDSHKVEERAPLTSLE